MMAEQVQHKPFEELVKKHFDAGADVHTAFGRAIDQDPEAYGEYLKRQKGTNERPGENRTV